MQFSTTGIVSAPSGYPKSKMTDYSQLISIEVPLQEMANGRRTDFQLEFSPDHSVDYICVALNDFHYFRRDIFIYVIRHRQTMVAIVVH